MTTPDPAFPFVGARAQVTVAQNGHGWSCRRVKDGEEVNVIGGPDVDGDYAVSNDTGDMGLVAARHLRPVPVSPGPDQPTEHDLCGGCDGVGDHGGPYRCPDCDGSGNRPTEHEDWRVGEHYSIHVYAVEPPPEGEPECPACVGFTPEHDGGAAEHVPQHDRPVATFHRPEDAARAVAAVNAEAGLRAEVQRLTETLRAEERSRKETYEKAVGFKAERDAARAELAAAHNTDGLGLPQVEVRRGAGALVAEAYSGSVWWPDARPSGSLREQTAAHLALLRARLADEATTEATADA